MSSYVPFIRSGEAKTLEVRGVDARLERRKQDDISRGHDHEHAGDQEKTGRDFEKQALSIRGLILFLEDFLESRLGSQLYDQAAAQASAFRPWLKQAHSNCNSAMAARAYAHCSKTGRRTAFPKSRDVDLSHIYELIRDLRALREAGLSVLYLDGDSGFIEGIDVAAQDAKSRIDQDRV